MDRVVVDTDVVSFAAKQDARFSFYHTHLLGKIPVVSFMTVAELEYWAMVRNWGSSRQEKLRTFLSEKFSIQPYESELCQLWAELTHEAQQKGHVLHSADAWIAATACRCKAPLLTHNAKHFSCLERLTVISASVV